MLSEHDIAVIYFHSVGKLFNIADFSKLFLGEFQPFYIQLDVNNIGSSLYHVDSRDVTLVTDTRAKHTPKITCTFIDDKHFIGLFDATRYPFITRGFGLTRTCKKVFLPLINLISGFLNFKDFNISEIKFATKLMLIIYEEGLKYRLNSQLSGVFKYNISCELIGIENNKEIGEYDIRVEVKSVQDLLELFNGKLDVNFAIGNELLIYGSDDVREKVLNVIMEIGGKF